MLWKQIPKLPAKAGKSLSLIWLQRAVSWSRSAAAATPHAGFRWLSSSVIRGEGWCPPQNELQLWSQHLVVTAVRQSTQLGLTGILKVHWEPGPIDQSSGFFLGPWQGARCHFWSFSPAAKQSKNWLCISWEWKWWVCPFFSFDKLFSSRALKISVFGGSVLRT